MSRLTIPEDQYAHIKARSRKATTEIGRRLADLRSQRGLSQEDLSRRTGLTQGAISMLEVGDGNPTVLTLVRYAEALGVTVGEFFIGREA